MFIDERERERETLIGGLPYAPQWGVKPATWVCALTRNQTHDLLVYGMMLQLTGQLSQGKNVFCFCLVFLVFKTHPGCHTTLVFMLP